MRRAAVAWAVLAAACEQPRTELVARVDSEVAWGAGRTIQAVTLTVRRGGPTGSLRSARTTVLGAGSDRRPLPLTVGILPGDDLDTPVWIEALGCADPNGCDAEGAVVAQRAVVRFTRGRTEEVPLLLASACVGAMCGGDERCGDGGRCEPATRAVVRPFGGVDAAGADVAASDLGGMDTGNAVDATTVDRVTGDASDSAVGDVGSDGPPLDVATPDAISACGSLELSCGGICRRVLTDPMHCGDCSVVCPAVAGATAVCMGGRCSYTCDSTHADCDERPSNGCESAPASDPENCGACGRGCNEWGSCVASACVDCPVVRDQQQYPCGGTCVDIGYDAANCGACGRACGAGQRCAGRVCVMSTCPMGMLHIVGGTFTMGSDVSEYERPPHRVRVSDFCMDRTEVTVARYRACVMAGRCSAPALGTGWDAAARDPYPVTGVDFARASSFCSWSGATLPTEAQWEYAARGTDGRTYPWGNADPGGLQICWSPSGRSPCIAGGSRDDVSPFGVMDLGANLVEWTRDWYTRGYIVSDAGVIVDPVGETNPFNQRALRGADFSGTNPIDLRATRRSGFYPDRAESSFGIRCVATP